MSLTSSIPKRCPGLGWGLLLGMLILFGCSLCLGAAGYSLSELWAEQTILLYARLPRSVGCLLAGASLAGAGFLLQTVLNNALASPGILGVNSGAGLAVIIAAIVLPGSVTARTVGAFLGAFWGAYLGAFFHLYQEIRFLSWEMLYWAYSGKKKSVGFNL